MKKNVCVLLGAGTAAVTRQVPGEDPRARRVMTENGLLHVIDALTSVTP